MTKMLLALIKNRVSLGSGPWRFQVAGKSGMKTTRQASANTTWDKLKAWAESEGAEATLIEDQFSAFYASGYDGPLGSRYLVVEITDPAAQVIETLLKNAK